MPTVNAAIRRLSLSLAGAVVVLLAFPGGVRTAYALRGESRSVVRPAPPARRPTQGSISLRQFGGVHDGAVYGLKWTDSGQKCFLAQALKGRALDWKAVGRENCGPAIGFLFSHAPQFEKEAQDDLFADPTSVSAQVRVEIPGRSFLMKADLMTSPHCKTGFKQCVYPKLSSASLLALEVRRSLAKNLGRLPASDELADD